ncbi:hypothetical protein HDE_00497 [Halotydeus destructor]|nr:hypothetical protein HDE_00497 [Halotydeus destructor]
MEEYYNYHGLFGDDFALAIHAVPALSQKLKIIPFYKIYLEQAVNNRLFYQWTRFSLDERIALGITDDKPVELIALRLLLNDENLDFIRLPLEDLETTAPVYLGRNNYIWTSHPFHVNPTFRSDQIEPDFYMLNVDYVIEVSDLPTLSVPNKTHESIRRYDDSNKLYTYYCWQNMLPDSVVFTDPNDICVPGTTYYSSQIEKELVVHRSSFLRSLAQIRVATRNIPTDEFVTKVREECQFFHHYRRDPALSLRKLPFLFGYHQPLTVFHEGDDPLKSGTAHQIPSMFYSRKVTPQAQLIKSLRYVVTSEHGKDDRGIALLINPRRIGEAHAFDAYVIGSTDISTVVVVDHQYAQIQMYREGNLVDEVNALFIKDHQKMHNALMLYTENVASNDCVYNGIVWGSALTNGLVSVNSHLSYAGNRSYQNMHYLANPFMTTENGDISKLCKRSVAWRVGSFYIVPAESDAYIILPHICEGAKLSVENGPSISSGSLLFIARLQEHHKHTKDFFGSLPAAKLHLEKLLTASFVFYFDIRRNSSLPMHEFDKVPMVNEQHKMFLQESPHAAAAYQSENNCVIS